MRNKSRVEETEKKSSELIVYVRVKKKLAGRFIYKGCWGKNEGSNRRV